MYDDSLLLAQACETLRKYPVSYFKSPISDVYAHACYHYGRLLRERENPAAAMEAFLHAAHSRTRDYHILGRVYSNIGSICHLANEFPLAYDMYERSANCFLMGGDTLLYYYGLNNMAFELAEQASKEETLALLSRIETDCADSNIQTKLLETEAEMYLYCHQYDSAIYYAKTVYKRGNEEPTGLLICAQAYSLLGIKDSAVLYANQVLSTNPSLPTQCNALYILTNDDETKSTHSIRETAADRADVQKLLEIRQGKLSQAVQLLEQDLHRKPDLRWLYAIIATLVIVGIGIAVYIKSRRKRHNLLSQKINALTEKHNALTERYRNNRRHMEDEINNKCMMLRSNSRLTTELAWTDFNEMCKIVDRYFYLLASKLHNKHVLNETETRLCILVLLDMSRSEISNTLPYALNSVGKLKDHTAKLLGTQGRNLRSYLVNLAIED